MALTPKEGRPGGPLPEAPWLATFELSHLQAQECHWIKIPTHNVIRPGPSAGLRAARQQADHHGPGWIPGDPPVTPITAGYKLWIKRAPSGPAHPVRPSDTETSTH